MLNKIEVKLINEDGSYSIAYVDYNGYVNMLEKHKISMLDDVLEAMVKSYKIDGKMDFNK